MSLPAWARQDFAVFFKTEHTGDPWTQHKVFIKNLFKRLETEPLLNQYDTTSVGQTLSTKFQFDLDKHSRGDFHDFLAEAYESVGWWQTTKVEV